MSQLTRRLFLEAKMTPWCAKGQNETWGPKHTNFLVTIGKRRLGGVEVYNQDAPYV